MWHGIVVMEFDLPNLLHDLHIHSIRSTLFRFEKVMNSSACLHRSGLEWVSTAVHLHLKQTGHANDDRQRVVVFQEV